MRVGLDLRPLTAAPYSSRGRQALALYNTVRLRPGTEALPFTNAPLTHQHRTWAYCPARPASIEGLRSPMARLRFERDFLPEAISTLAVDVHVATGGTGLPTGLSDVRRKRTRWVLQMHDLFPITQSHLRNGHDRDGAGLKAAFLQWFDRWRIRHALELADAIWAPSAYTAQAIADHFPATQPRLRLLPDAVPLEAWQKLHQDVFAPQRYWLLVGTREPRKRIAWFLQAWQQARDLWPDLIPPLVLIGHPRDVASVPQHVRFVHGINDAQLGSWYRQAERVWQPSVAEGFGLPVIEAAACGTPVATARGSSLDEITPPGALRFDPHDMVTMTQVMHQAARQGRGDQESPQALQDWASRYDLPPYALRVGELLKELV